MLSIQDLLALLDHWPLWKRIKESPARLDALEKHIAGLEAKLAPATGERYAQNAGPGVPCGIQQTDAAYGVGGEEPGYVAL